MDLPALALAAGVAWTPAAVTIPKGVPLGPILPASSVFDASGAPRTWNEALADLATARVIAVGESHDDASHHAIQAEVLTALSTRVPRLAVAFEMVCREDQGVLDAYMSGAMTEAAFAVWWKNNWGYDFSLYKPIFDAAKAAGVPAYGLNAPISLVKAVSKGGLASLSPSDRARLPFKIAQSGDSRYQSYVLAAVSGHGPLTPVQLQNRLESMAVWNETMGEQVSKIAAEGRTVLVIAGQGHVLFKAGLVESAAKRGAAPSKVLLPWDGAPQTSELPLGDWFRTP